MELQLVIDNGVPQFACDSCYKCESKFGQSLCSVKNRGCCFYYPKFNLVDIHKMVNNKEGLEILDRIINLPNVKIYNYYIHAKGDFDESGYNKYIESIEFYEDEMKDKTIYFRTCPFVLDGKGCTLHPSYRSYVCNFFLCDEVVNKLNDNIEYNRYVRERDSYVKWFQYENTSLELALKEKGINLIEHYNEVIQLLKTIPIDEYELMALKKIEVL